MVKGKRWKKGQSSSSNPETKKFREAAKSNRIFSFGLPTSTEKSSLTQKALAELDSRSNIVDNDAHSLINDNESIDTFKSWATNWSDCTNATFNKVHRYWHSNSALHKEILAVLAAVTEIIKEKDGKESEIEYFAALMTGIESVKENEESTAAFLYLIALAIKKVPESILRVKFLQLLKTLLNPLVEYGEKANNITLIKAGLMCLCWLLKSQDKQTWKLEETQNAYMLILSFIDHQKPKIRKCGQEAVRLILKSCSSSDASYFGEISAFTAEYCLELIQNGNKLKITQETENKKSANTKQSALDSQTQTILHTLSLLKYSVHYFQLNTLKSVGECLLTLMTLKDILITSSCLQILHELFESQVTHLNAELNGQIINALYDYQPSENDPQQLIAWLAVIESAVKCLNRLNKQICLSHLPSIVQKFMSALSSSHHQNVHAMTTNFLCNILEQCVQTNVLLFVDDIKESPDFKKSLLSKIFTHIEAGLSYQYHTSWVFVMKILACAFTSFKHRDTFIVVEKCLSSLANLRESEQFEYKKEADFAIGRAIKNYGPQLILDCIPLQITGDEKTFDYPRSWMLPLLKENIEKTELAYFVDHLYPLAKKLRAKSDFFQHTKKLLEAKIFENLQNQIWSLLPGFCDFCLDFKDSFKSIAKQLGETLEKSHDLRYYVLHGLKNLINRNTDENKVLMGKFAKNYLPIMFNIYTTEITLENDSVRQTLVDTIRSYLQIADSDLINQYLIQSIKNYENFAKLCQEHKTDNKDGPVVFDFNKMTKDDTNSKPQTNLNVFAKHSFMDLIAILVKYVNHTNISVVFEMTMTQLENKSTDKTDQKKFYKVLYSILNSGKPSLKEGKNEAIYSFIDGKIELIANLFTSSLGKCNAAAKVPRLKCLIDLMDYVKDCNQKVFLRQLLPEIILCVKELNHKSRDTAFELLNTMVRLWQKLGTNSVESVSEIDSLYEFFHLIMVGLAGSTNMVSCTCLALSSLAHEYRENISGPLIGELIETACLLVKSEQKEIIISSLNLLKILCIIFNQATLAQYLKQIGDVIHGLHEKRGSATNTSENSFNNIAPITKSQQIRTLVKMILKKLIKKFSYQLVLENVFACEKISHDGMSETTSNKRILTAAVKQGLENLLTNIRKAIEKDKKRKEEQNSDKKSEQKLDLISMYTSKTKQTNKYNEVEELLKESDSEEEDAKDARSQKTNKTNKSVKKERTKKESANPLAWIQENESDDPIDLLDPMAIKRVLATKPLTKEEIEMKKAKEAKSKAKNRGFKLSNDGKILIDDDSDDEDKFDSKSSKSKSKNKKSDDIEEMMDTLSLSKKSLASKKSNKLKRNLNEMDSDDDSVDDKISRNSYKAGGSGIHRKLDKNKKEIPDHGAEYRSKKARGDVKRKNMPDPYAYIPLNMSKLNKRKRAKLQGEYKGVVKAVKRGAQKASKFK